MLRYKIKLSNKQESNPIEYKELYLDKDLSYISGVMDYNEGIRNGEIVSISSPYLETAVQLPIELTLVRRQGYVLANEKYPIEQIRNVGDNSNPTYYVEFNGSYYYRFTNNVLDGFLIDGNFLTPSTDNTVTIPTKHWIENGELTIRGERYYADMNLVQNSNFANGYAYPTIKKYWDNSILEKIDGTDIKIFDYEYSKWHNIYKFVIRTNGKREIIVDDATSGNRYPFVQYGNDLYTIKSYNEGYGAYINDKFYEMEGINSLEEFETSDDPSIYIDNVRFSVKSNFQVDGNGSLLVLFVNGKDIPFAPYDTLVAESDDPFFSEKVQKAKNGNLYVNYDGVNYLVEPNVCDTVSINGEPYTITYSNTAKTLGFIQLDGQNVDLSFFYENSIKKACLKNKIYYLNSKDLVSFGEQKESKTESAYTVTEISGITLSDGAKCQIYSNDGFFKTSSEIDESSLRCLIRGKKKYELLMFGLAGSNMLFCSSIAHDDDVFEQKKINSEIRDNIGHFHFYLKKELFGDVKITPMIGAELALGSDHPISSKSISLLDKDLTISKLSNYLTLPITLMEQIDPNIGKEDLIDNGFVEEKVSEGINSVVDMEKDVYYPCLKSGNTFKAIDEIVFNLHFRTRDLESWKVIQDDSVEIGNANGNSLILSKNYNECNWFVTDFYDYADKINDSENGKTLQMTSDLIGLLNFTDDDVRYRKKKIGKSFLRLSFYSTTNPQTQVLLSTSTIFMDENKLFKKFISGKHSDNYTYKEIQKVQDDTSIVLKNSVDVVSERYDTSSKEIVIDDSVRLDSSIIVKDKYNSDNSSEGFYLYLFREYSSSLREGTVYMKVDFCHAGNGLVIPFIIPRSVDNGNVLYLSNYEDINEMKEGVPLNKLYDNLYIPIKVIYSDKDKKFWYYLPSEYVENGELGLSDDDDNKMFFNLFELKIRNQSYETDF